MRTVIAILLFVGGLAVASPARAAVAGANGDGDSGLIFGDVGSGPWNQPGREAPTAPATSSGPQTTNGTPTPVGTGPSAQTPSAPATAMHPGLTYAQCVAFLEFSEDRDACARPVPAVPAAEPEVPAAPAAPEPPPVDPGIVAQSIRETMPVTVPTPHLSPAEAGFQLTGLPTWFWLEPDDWRPVAVRAEVPGAWIEVTATPTRATWDPGDGAPAVTCDGPARPHPGTPGATTACGHTYVDVGGVEVGVTVTFAVTWVASTGETGEVAPLSLSTSLAVDVQQRQAVID